jgi:N-acetylglucosamine-6-phosphate deacetylase
MNKNKSLLITNIAVYHEGGIFEQGFIKIKAGKIIDIGPVTDNANQKADEIISLTPNFSLVPGFIDIHIHGVKGADTMDGTPSALSTMACSLPREGTTSFLATTITQSSDQIEAALSNAATYSSTIKEEPAAEMLGIHLEGPFISPERAGAQPLSFIQEPDLSLFEKWQQLSGGLIKLVTMAPERENGLELLRYLTDSGVIASIGHSDASYHEIQEAISKGLSHVTHLYNGMRGFHHREPGVAGAALAHHELKVEMIVDGIHIHPAIVKSTYRTKGASEIILITDAMRAKGLKDGTYDLGGQKVQVSNQKALLSDGTLAGSILTMNDAIKNMIQYTGCSLQEITVMASENPAKQIGVWNQKGSITVGKDADLTILDQDLNVIFTLCNGKIAYQGGIIDENN